MLPIILKLLKQFSGYPITNLSISHTNGGSVNDVNASYPEDTNVNIIATPEHMEFVDGFGDGVSDPLFPNTVVFMTADRNITAIFQPKLYNLDVTFSGVGSVTGVGEYAYGETVSISATPSLGYEFSHWEGFGIDANTSTSQISITQDQQIKAVFLPQQQTFTANPLNPNHGDVFIAESPHIETEESTIFWLHLSLVTHFHIGHQLTELNICLNQTPANRLLLV